MVVLLQDARLDIGATPDEAAAAGSPKDTLGQGREGRHDEGIGRRTKLEVLKADEGSDQCTAVDKDKRERYGANTGLHLLICSARIRRPCQTGIISDSGRESWIEIQTD